MKKLFTLMAMVMMSVTSSFAQTTDPLSFNPDEDGHFFLNREEAVPHRMQAVNAKSKALRKAQAKSTKVLLDSVVDVRSSGIRSLMYIYEYDENGYQIGSYLPSRFKYEYTYDENGNQTSETYYSWDTAIKDWVNKYRDEYTYDDKGNNTRDSYYSWESDAWSYGGKYEYTYNENGNMTEYCKIDTTNTCLYKCEYVYDERGNFSTETVYELSSDNELVPSVKYEGTYDANGNCTCFVGFNKKDGAWVYSYKFDNAYDENGNETLNIFYNWIDGEWAISSRYEYTYDENGNQVWYKHYKWTNGEWKNSINSYMYSYDADGNKIAEQRFTLSSAGELVPSYSYNSYYHTFPSPALGDVNGDGKVSVADVTKITDHLLNLTPGVFNGSAADVNGNNKIDADDAKALSNMILNK